MPKKPYVEDEESKGRPDALVADLSWEKYERRNKSVVVDLFTAQLKSTLICPQCEQVSCKFDPYVVLSLPLPNSSKRTALVRVERLTYDMSAPAAGGVAARWLVPTPSAAAAPCFGRVGREADPRRATRFTTVACTVDRQDKLRALRAAVAAETGVPQDRWLLIYQARGGFGVLPEDKEVGALLGADGINQSIIAFELAPAHALPPSNEALARVGSEIVAYNAAAAGPAGAAPATDADAGAAQNLALALAPPYLAATPRLPAIASAPAAAAVGLGEGAAVHDDTVRASMAAAAVAANEAGAAEPRVADRITCIITHSCTIEDDGLAGEAADSRDRWLWDPAGLDPKVLRKNSEPIDDAMPTFVSLPRGASAAQLRMSAARAVLPCMKFTLFSRWLRLQLARERRLRAAAAAAAAGGSGSSAVAVGGDGGSAPDTEDEVKADVAAMTSIKLSDGVVLRELARRLPLAAVATERSAAGGTVQRIAWVPTFTDAGEGSYPADAVGEAFAAATPAAASSGAGSAGSSAGAGAGSDVAAAPVEANHGYGAMPGGARALRLEEALPLPPPRPAGAEAPKNPGAGATVACTIFWRGAWAVFFDETRAASSAHAASAQRALEDARDRASGASSVTLAECWDKFEQSETLDEENMWYCNRCRDHVQATKTLAVWSLPDVLVLHLKRFECVMEYVHLPCLVLLNSPVPKLCLLSFCSSLLPVCFSTRCYFKLQGPRCHYARQAGRDGKFPASRPGPDAPAPQKQGASRWSWC